MPTTGGRIWRDFRDSPQQPLPLGSASQMQPARSGANMRGVQIPEVQMPDMSRDINQAMGLIDAEIQQVRAATADATALFEQARAEARTARDEALTATNQLIGQIQSSWEGERVDVGSLVGEYTERMEGAIGMMGTGAQRAAEYQVMQLTSLAATGKLGSNPFAVQRQMSRAAGDIIAQTLGEMGRMQAHMADQVGELTLRGQSMNQQLFSQTMSTLAGLVGTSANIQMQHAGLVAQTYQAQAQAAIQVAGISANLAGLKVGAIQDFTRIRADFQRMAMNQQHERVMAQSSMAHDRAMRELDYSMRIDLMGRQAAITERDAAAQRQHQMAMAGLAREHDMNMFTAQSGQAMVMGQNAFEQTLARDMLQADIRSQQSQEDAALQIETRSILSEMGFDLLERMNQMVHGGQE